MPYPRMLSECSLIATCNGKAKNKITIKLNTVVGECSLSGIELTYATLKFSTMRLVCFFSEQSEISVAYHILHSANY